MQIYCKVDYDNWPFGPQKCEFKIGSWYHGLTKIDVKHWIPEGDETEHFWNNQVITITYKIMHKCIF